MSSVREARKEHRKDVQAEAIKNLQTRVAALEKHVAEFLSSREVRYAKEVEELREEGESLEPSSSEEGKSLRSLHEVDWTEETQET